MASSYLEVGSEGLTNLKDDLTKLSNSLHEVFELMNADMRQVGEAWRDGKYEEFVNGYRPQINKCEEISQRYMEWCKRVLDPAIEECIAIETTDVGGDSGGSTSGGGSEVSNSAGGGEVISGNSKVAAFRRGIEKAKDMAKEVSTPGPQGSGFSTPQNERPRLSPKQIADLFNGKQR